MDVREIEPGEHGALGDLTVAAYRSLPGVVLSNGYEGELRDVAGRAAEAVVLVAVDRTAAAAQGAGHGRRMPGGATYVPGGATYVPGGVTHVLGGATYVPDSANPHAEFDDPEAAGIRMLAVDPAWWGRGVATALVRACIQRAREEGRARVLLHSTPSMATAQRLYRRMGFTRRADLDWRPAPEIELLGYAYELG